MSEDQVLEGQVIPWVRQLLSESKVLTEKKDAAYQHAYGIAQGVGFCLKNRSWPAFPTVSGSSFGSLVANEKARRDGNAPVEDQRADPLDPEAAPSFPSFDVPGIGAQERQAESLIRALLGQAKAYEPSDVSYRHALGIAQGYGALRRDATWPTFPTTPGSRFLALVAGAKAGPAPSAGPAGAGQAAPPGRRRMGAGFGRGKPGAAKTPAPAAPDPDSGGAAFRAQATIMEDDGDDDGDDEGGNEAFRAQNTFMEVEDEEEGGAEAFRAQGTLIEGDEDDEPDLAQATMLEGMDLPDDMPGGADLAQATMLEGMDMPDEDQAQGQGEAFRAMPTMMEVEPASDDQAFRAQPTFMEFQGENAAPVGDPFALGDEAILGGGASAAEGTMVEGLGDLPQGEVPPTPRPAAKRQSVDPLGASPIQASTPRRPSQRRGMRGGLQSEQQKQRQRQQEQRTTSTEQVERIGSFRVKKLLGKGAMGQVYLGTGLDGKDVAIKVLHQRLGKSKRVRARFMREAKAVERINHANVVSFFEMGEEEGLGRYIAMEFVDGLAMHDQLKTRRGKPFEFEMALNYFVQSCRGLRAAHRAGVIHRDLKPENILVSTEGVIKITDFSLARRDEDSMLLTRPGQVMGTPHFMSPEQARGEPVDGRTDIYSLGALLYVMLTGRFPFPKESVSEVIAAHCEDPRPDIRQYNQGVSPELAAFCQRVMALERKDRPPTVEALLDELNTIHPFETEAAPAEAMAGALPKGTTIDGHEIERVLGVGGMGAVYLAKKGGQDVALKILPAQPGRTPQERIKDVRRFHNEAKLAKRVRSHNTYDIRGFGVHAGQAYIALSLEDGISLRDLIAKRGFLDPDLIRKIGRGLGQALQAVREAGIIHRDVTPANVMLRGNFEEEPDAGVCLIDFGLAIPAERNKKATHTKGGVQLAHIARKEKEEEIDLDEDSLFLDDLPGGTPAYMAPEVLEDPGLVDERADLYGLGATLYHAATGHPPYTGDSMEAVIYQQRNQSPAPIQQFNADFPEDLEELVLQLLGTTPNVRPRSAKLVLSKLQRQTQPGAVTAWKPQQKPAEPETIYVSSFSWAAFGGGFLAGGVVAGVALIGLAKVGALKGLLGG